MDEEEIRRLEELIPGTDQEDEPPQPQTPSLLYRLLHRPRREEPMPEDIAPQQLARTYGKGLKGLRLRSLAIFLLATVAIFQLLVPALNFVWLPPLDNYQIQVWIAWRPVRRGLSPVRRCTVYRTGPGLPRQSGHGYPVRPVGDLHSG